MRSAILRPLAAAPDDPAIAEAARIIAAGGIVAIPTETVYGLAARADRDDAVARIFAAKGRPSHNPLIVHVADAGGARRWSSKWNAWADAVAREFWPGPVTVVLPAAEGLSSIALAGGSTVGLRVPAHPVALALLAKCGLPLAAPSANRSGEVSPTRAEHVIESLGDRIDAVLDGGACAVGIESTVIDLMGDAPIVLRPGSIALDRLERALGITIARDEAHSHAKPKSPGQVGRHYAPAIPLRLSAAPVVPARGEYCIVFAPQVLAKGVEGEVLPADAAEAAVRLYEALRDASISGAVGIVAQEPPKGHAWDGVRDRLRRAAM